MALPVPARAAPAPPKIVGRPCPTELTTRRVITHTNRSPPPGMLPPASVSAVMGPVLAPPPAGPPQPQSRATSPSRHCRRVSKLVASAAVQLPTDRHAQPDSLEPVSLPDPPVGSGKLRLLDWRGRWQRVREQAHGVAGRRVADVFVIAAGRTSTTSRVWSWRVRRCQWARRARC